MTSLSMEDGNKQEINQFNYPTFARYMLQSPAKAEEYRLSFSVNTKETTEKPLATVVENILSDDVVPFSDMGSAEEEKAPENIEEVKEIEGGIKDEDKRIIVTKDDEKELRKIYQERTGKKAFG